MTSLFGGLAGDYINGGFSRSLFEYSPTSKSLLKRAERVKSTVYNRDEIVEALKIQNANWKADTLALKNIQKLHDTNAVIVSCGYQSCLAGGPLYTAYIILTALNTAIIIEHETGTPAVPLFWLASDDDDIAEVSTLTLPDKSRIKFNTERYKGCAGFLPSPTSQLSGIPQINASDWEEYHAKLLVNFFSPLGVIFISPLQESTRRLRQPFFEKYTRHTGKISDALKTQSENLTEIGFKPQARIKADDAHCYRIKGQKRYRLRQSDQFPSSNEILSSALTRLLSIEYILPIAAEVSTPSEIAYHAQTKTAYETLDREMPVIIPGSSNTLVYKTQKDILTKSDISVESAIAPKRKMQFSENQTMDQYDSLFEISQGKAASVSINLHKKHESSITSAFDFLYPAVPQEREFAFFPFIEKHEGFLKYISEFCKPFDYEHHIIELEG
jgi:uncharacterized protein YllA (UPF0747 family)